MRVSGDSTPIRPGSGLRARGTRWTRITRWIGLAVAAVIAAVALVDVRIADPRVHVRWADRLTAPQRQALEQRYRLQSGEPVEGPTWRYELRDPSRDNVRALLRDPAVADTAYIDRPTATAPERELRVSFERARFLVGPNPAQLLQVQSLLLFGAGGVMLWAAGRPEWRRRRALAIGSLVAIAVLAYAFPLHQPIRMGDYGTYVASRSAFEGYSGVRQIRFEAHLAHATLGRLDGWLGATTESPAAAIRTLMRAATAWFILSALMIGAVERWSPVVVRYLGLSLLAPSALLYFGYLELGHLSLSVATFPLLARGLAERTRHLEAGNAFVGVGAALHGFGLLSLAGAALAAIATRVHLGDRARLAMRAVVSGLVAYLVWIPVYLIVLHLPVVPGHAEGIPLRPWLTDQVTDRVNAAILSRTGIRDVFFSAWVVGAPLLVVAGSLRRQYADEVRWALAYAVPSAIFTLMFWPIQGIAVEMDLVVAAFPALYALAWVCAHDARRTAIAAAVLVSAHFAFWRIVLDGAFINSRL